MNKLPSLTRSLTALLLFTLLLTACGGIPSASEDRQATFTLVLNDVRARPAESAVFDPVNLGDQITIGGQAQSGENSRARLDLEPDGTILRLGPNTLFTLEQLNDDFQNPLTRLNMTLGQLWVILAKGSLEVETPYGTGGVRGSYMSIAFDPSQGTTVTCLEGHCSLSNAAGTVELTDGQASSIPRANEPPALPRPINESEIQGWEQNNPESAPFIQPGTITPGVPIATGNTGSTAEPPTAQPIHYTLTNNCDLLWHWRFDGPQTVSLDVPVGETVSGELPVGTYTGVDWFDNGENHITGPVLPGGNIVVKSCPDK